MSSHINLFLSVYRFSDQDIDAAVDSSEDIPSFPQTYDEVACNISAPRAHLMYPLSSLV